MRKKMLENFWIIIILFIFIIIGYYIYKSYENKKNTNDNIEINNYYNVDYLFNNSYIDIPKTIEDFSSKEGQIYMYLDASNTMYIKYPNNEKYNKKIIGLPKGNITVYYNQIHDDYYEFLGKTENNDIYYTFVNINNKKDEKYDLIGNNIDKVYIPYYDKNEIYVNQKNEFATNYILYDNQNKLNYIDINDKKYVLKSDINSKKPYFDYICPDSNYYVCNKFMIYIAFNKEIIYNNKKLKNNNGNLIHAKDIFSTFEIFNKKNIKMESLSKKELNQNNYLFSSYIIDENQIAYQFDITSKGEKIVALNSETNKVKEYIYEKDKKLTIVFEDGTDKIIKVNSNKYITTSTIYDKSQNNDKKVLIQP